MKVLVGIITCARDVKFTTALEKTWVPGLRLRGFDVFYASGESLQCRDDYLGLPEKVRALCRYAQAQDVDYLLKVDCDTFLRPDLVRPPIPLDYCGRVRGPSSAQFVPEGAQNTADYCSGGAYWLSRRAIHVIAEAQLTVEHAEDRWVGNTLANAGIRAESLPGYIAPTTTPTLYLASPANVVIMQVEDPQQLEQMHSGNIPDPWQARYVG